jgi:hypothetical protein
MTMGRPCAGSVFSFILLLAIAFTATDASTASAKSKLTTDPFGKFVPVGPPQVVCVGNTIPILIEIPTDPTLWFGAGTQKGQLKLSMSATHGSITTGDSNLKWGGHARFFYTAISKGTDKLILTYSLTDGKKKTQSDSITSRVFEIKNCIYKINISGEDRKSQSGFIEATYFRAGGCLSLESDAVSGKVKSYVDFSAVGTTAAMSCFLEPKQEASSTINISGTLKKSLAQKAGEAFGVDYAGSATFILKLGYETFLKFPESKLTCKSNDSSVKVPVPFARKKSWDPPDDGFKEDIALDLNDIQVFPFGTAGSARYSIQRVNDASGCGDK